MPVRTVGLKKVATITIPAGGRAALSSTNIFATDFEIYFPTANVGNVAYVGDSTVDNTWIPRKKDNPYNFVSGTGSLGGTIPELGFNLAKIFVAGTSGDTAIVQYFWYDRT